MSSNRLINQINDYFPENIHYLTKVFKGSASKTSSSGCFNSKERTLDRRHSLVAKRDLCMFTENVIPIIESLPLASNFYAC
jgi:hypothetical protein